MKKFDAPQYLQLNQGGSQARLSILRNHAAYTNAPDVNLPPSRRLPSWREARAYGFHDWASAYAALSQGLGGNESVWYCFTGEQFRNPQWSDEIVRLRHTGWFYDAEFQEPGMVYRGFVESLTHERFVAGYEDIEAGSRVYFGNVFTNQEQAAQMADEHARVAAQREQESRAEERANQPQWYSSSMGYVELQLTRDQWQQGYHQGDCDNDVADLRKDAGIAAQLAKIDPEKLKLELREFGAWDEDELADHDQNLTRILWLACGELFDTNA
jgi:hypothetical protein